MESYREYYNRKIVSLSDDADKAFVSRKRFAREVFDTTRAIANLYLLSKNYLSVYSQYTSRCFVYAKAFDKHNAFEKVQSALTAYYDQDRDERYVLACLKALKDYVEAEIGDDMLATEESERHIRTIEEELAQRTLFNDTAFFLGLAKDYAKGTAGMVAEANTALYMATRYAVMTMAYNKGLSTKDFDNLPTTSAIAIAEKYGITNAPDMLPSLTEIQSLMNQTAAITTAQFTKWVNEIDNYLNTPTTRVDSRGCTSEFGGL